MQTFFNHRYNHSKLPLFNHTNNHVKLLLFSHCKLLLLTTIITTLTCPFCKHPNNHPKLPLFNHSNNYLGPVAEMKVKSQPQVKF